MGEHPVLARDVHIMDNKRKFMFILCTSKTHWKNSRPQSIKITSTKKKEQTKNHKIHSLTLPCPYTLLRQFLDIRGPYIGIDEPFFVFSDKTPVVPHHMQNCLKLMLKKAGFQHGLYSVHSLRMGRGCDLLKLGLTVETIKKIGRWKSNAVFRYLK